MKVGNIVDVYLDYQTELQWIGTGVLKKRLKKGLPFILEDSSDLSQVTYSSEYWYIDFIDHDNIITSKAYPIRYVLKNGRYTEKNVKKITYESPIIDSFLSVDGIEVF